MAKSFGTRSYGGGLSLRLPAALSALPVVREQLRHWLESEGATKDEVHDIVLASWEACANAMEHPMGPTAKEISLHAKESDREVQVSVRDSGLWLERSRVAREGRGFGIRLIEALMDDVEIERNPRETVVMMRRHLGRA